LSNLLIVALNGSPKKDGNTFFMLDRALDTCRSLGADTVMLQCREAMKELRNKFCINCESPCTAKCARGNSFENALNLLRRADGLIIGSPVYFGTVSGQLKAFWDKTRSLRTDKSLLNVPGGALAVGGSRFGGQETTIRAIHDLMLVQGMLVVGDGYGEDDCGHQGAAAQRPAEEDENGINRTIILAKRVFEVAQATRGIRRRGVGR
jgi:multimeric flavodoxin WrbA